MEEGKERVCVTGGTGFIGSSIIRRLLEYGYSVITTVRSHPGVSQRLQILNVDLREPESFKEVIEGCAGVFHLATPMDFEEMEPEEIGH